jgi:hypothetical protein
MCFSPQADILAGVVVGAVGLDGLRHVRRPSELWLAALPVVFAAHQLVEAVVWLGLQGHVGEDAWRLAMGIYLAIAFGLLPVLVPVAVASLEPRESRRRLLGWFTLVGAAVSVSLMYAVVRGPVDARIQNLHVDYSVDLWQGGLLVGLYAAATCGPMLVSGLRNVRWYGLANVIVGGALAWFNETAFISLWCLWAAITSVAIGLHLRLAHSDRQESESESESGARRGRDAASPEARPA